MSNLFTDGTIIPLVVEPIPEGVQTVTLRETIGPELENTVESTRILYELKGDESERNDQLYRLLAFGAPDFRIPGFLNYPNTSTHSSSLSYESRDFQRINYLIGECIAILRQRTSSIEIPSTVLLPEYMNYLEDSPFPRIMSEKGVKIHFLSELNQAGAYGEGSIIVYCCDRRKLKARILNTPSGRVKCTGTILLRPMSMLTTSLHYFP